MDGSVVRLLVGDRSYLVDCHPLDRPRDAASSARSGIAFPHNIAVDALGSRSIPRESLRPPLPEMEEDCEVTLEECHAEAGR